MADIVPFRGLRYNLRKVRDLSEVVIPPYDVISPQEQRAFHKASPYNMIHLELGQATATDSIHDNPHTRAAEYLERWQHERILFRDERPAIYYSELEYTLGSQQCLTRYGFIAALRLEDFAAGRVRPHERTFKSIKEERLGLVQACHANLSPVFGLYPDPAQRVDGHLRAGREAEPCVAFRDKQGMEHRLWRVEDPGVIAQVRALMDDKMILIADGHHRYETALAYRDLQRRRFADAGPQAAFEFVMMYLSNLNQQGLTILPTHRLLHRLDSLTPEAFLQEAQGFFELSEYPATETGRTDWCSALQLKGDQGTNAIGFHYCGADRLYLLRAKSGPVKAHLERCDIPEVRQDLDVVVLDEVILRHLLHLPESFLAEKSNIHFMHDLDAALAEVCSGYYRFGFFINPTRIEQVQAVADANLTMPHKSTYFYPKVGSGLVLRLLSAEAEGFA